MSHMENPYIPTMVTGGGKPGEGYPALRYNDVVRKLTPLECERVQGFPDHWTETLVKTSRYRVLGNAVCVPVAEWIGQRLMAVEQGDCV